MVDSHTPPGPDSDTPDSLPHVAEFWSRQVRLIQCELTMRETLDQKRVLPSHIENTWREIDLFLGSQSESNDSDDVSSGLLDAIQASHDVLRGAADDLTEQFECNTLNQSVFDSTAEQFGVVAARLSESAVQAIKDLDIAAQLAVPTQPASTQVSR